MNLTKKEIFKERDKIIDQVTQYCPVLRPFFELDMKLKDYSSFLYDFEYSATYLERQKLIKNKLDIKLKQVFGDNYKKELNVNLDNKFAINIADHHQVLNNPILTSSNLIGNVHKFLQPKKQEAIVVISSGDVPPNNYFSRSGFEFHNKRIPLFSASEKELTSYYIPKRDFNFVERLKISKRWKEFDDSEQKFLEEEQKEMDNIDFSRCKDYSDQITTIVQKTWPNLFEEKLRSNLPDLLYITQEEIVTECLIEILQEDNIISKSFFNEKFREEILNNFKGIVITWDEENQKGTHFFWRKYPDRAQSLRMYVRDGKLVPADERFKDLTVDLDKDTIIDLLKKREIYPSLFTIFSVLLFYMGIKSLVGSGSLVYLELMKNAWIKTLKTLGEEKELELVNQIQTNGFIAGFAVFFERKEGKLNSLYAADISYNKGLTEDYLKSLLDMKISDFLSSCVVGFYDYYSSKYVPKEKKIKPKITFEDLSELIFDWL